MGKIQTERLLLEPFVNVDFEAFSALRSDPTVMLHMVGGPTTGQEAQELFDAYLAAWQGQGLGMWAVRDRENLDYVGECGFWNREGEVGLTIRYLLHKKYWGRGLAGEAVNAAVRHGLERADIRHLSALALRDNTRSCSILERLGMNVVEENHQGVEGFRRYVLPLNG